MNIELTRASSTPSMAPVATARPPGETQSAAQQTTRTRQNAELASAEQNGRNNAQASNSIATDQQQVVDAVEKLSKFVSSIRPEISFSVDEDSGTRVVKIIDRQSKEVVRQIPSEEAIQLAQALDKLQGLFVRDTA
jgi:flagellar protein FlaG